jgi:hypothetical protein
MNRLVGRLDDSIKIFDLESIEEKVKGGIW